jgi:hypothetical protein
MKNSTQKGNSVNNAVKLTLISDKKLTFEEKLIMHTRNGIEKMYTNQELPLAKIIKLTPAGKAFWLHEVSPTMAGALISKIVEQQLLPIVYVGKTASNWHIYRKL